MYKHECDPKHSVLDMRYVQLSLFQPVPDKDGKDSRKTLQWLCAEACLHGKSEHELTSPNYSFKAASERRMTVTMTQNSTREAEGGFFTG